MRDTPDDLDGRPAKRPRLAPPPPPSASSNTHSRTQSQSRTRQGQTKTAPGLAPNPRIESRQTTSADAGVVSAFEGARVGGGTGAHAHTSSSATTRPGTSTRTNATAGPSATSAAAPPRPSHAPVWTSAIQRPAPPVSRPTAPIPRPDFGRPLSPPAKSSSKAKGKSKASAALPLRPYKAPVWTPVRAAGSSSNSSGGGAKSSKDTGGRDELGLKPPLHALSAFRHHLSAPAAKPKPPQPKLPSKPLMRITSLVPLLPARPSTSTSTSTKPLRPLSALAPPTFALPPKHPPTTRLMRITQTPIARATDPRTPAGLTELLALHVAAHGSGYVSPREREARRGLEQSPEKRGRGKEERFLVGGLAATAARRFAAARSTHHLWELDADRRGAPSTRTDVRIRILAVLSSSSPSSSSSPQNPLAPLALPSHSSTPHAPPTLLVHALILTAAPHALLDWRPHREAYVLLRLPVRAEVRAKARWRVEVGREVCLGRPWWKVGVPGGGDGDGDVQMHADAGSAQRDAGAPHNPNATANSNATVEANSKETAARDGWTPATAGHAVWFCARYWVPPPRAVPTGMLPVLPVDVEAMEDVEMGDGEE